MSIVYKSDAYNVYKYTIELMTYLLVDYQMTTECITVTRTKERMVENSRHYLGGADLFRNDRHQIFSNLTFSPEPLITD